MKKGASKIRQIWCMFSLMPERYFSSG